jgi:hypothetical protein
MEELSMSKYVYLFTAEGADGLFVFKAISASCASEGDMIRYNGEVFEIKDCCYCSIESDEYRMIGQLAEIREADAIYTVRWVKPEDRNEDT